MKKMVVIFGCGCYGIDEYGVGLFLKSKVSGDDDGKIWVGGDFSFFFKTIVREVWGVCVWLFFCFVFSSVIGV